MHEYNLKKINTSKEEISSLFLLSIFFLVFGFAIIIAIFFTKSVQGKFVNLICGIIFILFSLLTFYKAFSYKKNMKV